jgi:hypothetical protein
MQTNDLPPDVVRNGMIRELEKRVEENRAIIYEKLNDERDVLKKMENELKEKIGISSLV